MISQLTEETSTLTQTVSALSSEFHKHHAMLLKLEEGQSHRDGMLSSLMAETRANLASRILFKALFTSFFIFLFLFFNVKQIDQTSLMALCAILSFEPLSSLTCAS